MGLFRKKSKMIEFKKEFKEEIRDGLKDLNGEQMIYYAWLCSVRALPFLGVTGHFNFWGKEKIETHLNSIFYALDVCIGDNFSATNDVYDGAITAARAAAYSCNSAYDAAAAVAYAVRSTANRIVFDADAVVAYTVRAAESSSVDHNIDIKQVAMSDIKAIKENKPVSNNDIHLYGKVWTNFQKALKDAGFEYWGKLYEDIFNNAFVINREKLEIRLNIDKSIREKGVAAIVKELQRIDEQESCAAS